MPQILSGIGQVCTYILKYMISFDPHSPPGQNSVTGEETEVDRSGKYWRFYMQLPLRSQPQAAGASLAILRDAISLGMLRTSEPAIAKLGRDKERFFSSIFRRTWPWVNTLISMLGENTFLSFKITPFVIVYSNSPGNEHTSSSALFGLRTISCKRTICG